MPVSPAAIGRTTAPLEVTIERGRLRLFANAIGQTDPLYLDPQVARAHGHRDLSVPPTFLFGLELERPDPFGWITDLGVNMNKVLHATQNFDYSRLTYAGDTLTVSSAITDVYVKKHGALEFIERRTTIERQREIVARLQQVLVVRNAT